MTHISLLLVRSYILLSPKSPGANISYWNETGNKNKQNIILKSNIDISAMRSIYPFYFPNVTNSANLFTQMGFNSL